MVRPSVPTGDSRPKAPLLRPRGGAFSRSRFELVANVMQRRESRPELGGTRSHRQRVAAQSVDDEFCELRHVRLGHAPPNDLRGAEPETLPFVTAWEADGARQDVGFA